MRKCFTLALLFLVMAGGCSVFKSSNLPQQPSTGNQTPAGTRTPTYSPTRNPIVFVWGEVLMGIRNLTLSLKTPDYFLVENPQKRGGEFDPNSFFTVLGLLSMEPGYALDYVYVYENATGLPYLYARPPEQASYRSISELTKATGLPAADTRYNYLAHVQVTDTEEGFFQFVVLYVMADQFYQYSSTHYNDTRLVLDTNNVTSALNTVADFGIKVPGFIKNQALSINLTPVLKMGLDIVTIRLVTFTMWGGFFESIYTIQRNSPHKISVESTILVPYNIDIQY